MDGIHDMGGMDGFGSVYPEPNEPVFHEHWEGRVLALNRAMGACGTWTIDEGRFGIEVLPPDVYLVSSYYRRWLLRLERLLVQYGVIDADGGRSCFASWRNLGVRPFHCSGRRSCSTPPLVRAASTHDTAVQDR
jgi:hypothetical protein